MPPRYPLGTQIYLKLLLLMYPSILSHFYSVATSEVLMWSNSLWGTLRPPLFSLSPLLFHLILPVMVDGVIDACD